MSTPHHATDTEAQRRLIDEIFGRAKIRWPQGQIAPDDQGETAFAIAVDPPNRIIRIQFTKPIIWLGLDRESAVKLRDLLTEKIKEL